jgi:hypothetical protein
MNFNKVLSYSVNHMKKEGVGYAGIRHVPDGAATKV